jgi:hypothetical protein
MYKTMAKFGPETVLPEEITVKHDRLQHRSQSKLDFQAKGITVH